MKTEDLDKEVKAAQKKLKNAKPEKITDFAFKMFEDTGKDLVISFSGTEDIVLIDIASFADNQSYSFELIV